MSIDLARRQRSHEAPNGATDNSQGREPLVEAARSRSEPQRGDTIAARPNPVPPFQGSLYINAIVSRGSHPWLLTAAPVGAICLPARTNDSALARRPAALTPSHPGIKMLGCRRRFCAGGLEFACAPFPVTI